MNIRSKPECLEQHHRVHELKSLPRETYRGVDYVVALGELKKVHGPDGMLSDIEQKVKKEHPDGFYEYEWVLFRDEKPWIGGSGMIDKNHDTDKAWDEETREKARFNAVRNAARWAIDNGAKETLEMDK